MSNKVIIYIVLLMSILIVKCYTIKKKMTADNVGFSYSYNIERTIFKISNNDKKSKQINSGNSIGNKLYYYTNNKKCIHVRNRNRCLFISKEYPYSVTLQHIPDTVVGFAEPPYYNLLEFINFAKTNRIINVSQSLDNKYSISTYWNINSYYKLDTVKIYYRSHKIEKAALIKVSKNYFTKKAEYIMSDIISFQNFDRVKIDTNQFNIDNYLKVDSINSRLIYNDSKSYDK